MKTVFWLSSSISNHEKYSDYQAKYIVMKTVFWLSSSISSYENNILVFKLNILKWKQFDGYQAQFLIMKHESDYHDYIKKSKFPPLPTPGFATLN